jgi:excisionase family DNA binding protein
MNNQTTNPVALGPKLLTPKQPAQSLAISERTLWTLTKSGQITHVPIGRLVRYDVADLQKWIERCKSKPVEPEREQK